MAAEDTSNVSTLFKPGTSGNYKGRPKVSPEINAIKAECKEAVLEAICKQLMTAPAELAVLLNDPRTTAAQQMIGRMIMTAMKKGCVSRTQFLFGYVLGRPKVFEDDGGDEGGGDGTARPMAGIPLPVLMELMTKYKPEGT